MKNTLRITGLLLAFVLALGPALATTDGAKGGCSAGAPGRAGVERPSVGEKPSKPDKPGGEKPAKCEKPSGVGLIGAMGAGFVAGAARARGGPVAAIATGVATAGVAAFGYATNDAAKSVTCRKNNIARGTPPPEDDLPPGMVSRKRRN